jgi:hypothetical protein
MPALVTSSRAASDKPRKSSVTDKIRLPTIMPLASDGQRFSRRSFCQSDLSSEDSGVSKFPSLLYADQNRRNA